MTKVIAFANQKGGVAKTTSTINTAHALVAAGQRVLMIDADPQASLSLVAGIFPETLIQLDEAGKTLHQGLTRKASGKDIIQKGQGLDIIPGSIRLARIEQEIASYHGISGVLKALITPVLPDYDVVLIDCPPTLSLLTVNALTLADYVVIPCKTDYLSVMGIPLLMDTISETIERSNPKLKVLCILPTLFNARASHDATLLDNLKGLATRMNVTVFEPVNRATAYDKANADGQSVVRDYPETPGADQYNRLAQTIINLGN
jgi:chromosome partitioning protein